MDVNIIGVIKESPQDWSVAPGATRLWELRGDNSLSEGSKPRHHLLESSDPSESGMASAQQSSWPCRQMGS